MKCMPCEKYAKTDMPVRLSGVLANYPIILSDSCTILEEPTISYSGITLYKADETRPVSLTTDEMPEVK